jgi:FtsP/CotA-like multicopper oxidase with cupredoxin domain
VSSHIEARTGQRILLRINNVSVTRFYTLASTLPLQVVGLNARLLRGPDPDGTGPLAGKNLYYTTNSVTLGGGEALDALVDLAGVAPGTYLLYTSNLNYLSNKDEAYGGMMTEIRVYPAGTLEPQAVAGPGGQVAEPRGTQMALGIE